MKVFLFVCFLVCGICATENAIIVLIFDEIQFIQLIPFWVHLRSKTDSVLVHVDL